MRVQEISSWNRRGKVFSLLALIVVCGLAVLSYRYLTGVDHGLRSVLSAWNRGDKLEAIRRYKELLRRHPEVNHDSLAEMCAIVYKEKKSAEPQLAQECKADAVRLMEDLIARSQNNGGRLFVFARLYDEDLDEPQRALRLYKQCLPLLDFDTKAIAQGKPDLRGYMVAEAGRASIVKENSQDMVYTSNRLVVIELSLPGNSKRDEGNMQQ
jgi:tetratricopeptide (TPR) repeat protein